MRLTAGSLASEGEQPKFAQLHAPGQAGKTSCKTLRQPGVASGSVSVWRGLYRGRDGHKVATAFKWWNSPCCSRPLRAFSNPIRQKRPHHTTPAAQAAHLVHGCEPPDILAEAITVEQRARS